MSGTAIATPKPPASSSSPPNRESWPIASLRLMSTYWSTAVSWIATSARRRCPIESNAPALISDSITRLLQTSVGTLSMKSAKSVKRPCSRRAADDRVDDVDADVADRGQPEADVGADRGEVGLGLVDVRRQHLDLHPAALVEVDRHLVLVVLDGREERGHVLGRVVGLEVGGPVGHQAVRRGVRLVEGVVGERQQDVPQRLDRARRSSRAPACPRRSASNCLSSSSFFFLPIARRSRSAWPSE